MSMNVKQVKEWIEDLPDNARIGLAEDFLGLEVDTGRGSKVLAWIECGMRLSSREVKS